jgi:hypothetical protein
VKKKKKKKKKRRKKNKKRKKKKKVLLQLTGFSSKIVQLLSWPKYSLIKYDMRYVIIIFKRCCY